MREPPADLAADSLRASLRDQYGLNGAALTFLPLGHDSSAWVYRADDVAGRSYFVKVRLRIQNEASLLVPRYLHEHGLRRVVAPLPTILGESWGRAGRYAMILYPYVAGGTGMERRLSAGQWHEYGALLRQIHGVAITPDLARRLRHEAFVPEWGAMVRRLDQHIGTREFADPLAQELAAFWRARREEICTVVARAETIGHQLARAAPPLVLCHADIHTGNLIAAAAGRLWIVDWDETIVAPAERDLMFAIGGISGRLVTPIEEALFVEGYGAVSIDPLALAYYRYAWTVGDIGSFGEQVLCRPDLGDVAQREGVERFKGLFASGEIVSIALASSIP